MTAERVNFLFYSRAKLSLVSDTVPRRREHVAYIRIGTAVIIVITPGDTHPRRHIFNSLTARNVNEFSITIKVEVIAPEIVSHIKVGVPIQIKVCPRTSIAVSGIINI